MYGMSKPHHQSFQRLKYMVSIEPKMEWKDQNRLDFNHS
jgi:hypothetical protein